MKLKYTGKVVKTVNYAEVKYLYLVPGCECLISNKDIESERIQALIKSHELKIIKTPKVDAVDIPVTDMLKMYEDNIKKDKKKREQKRSIKKKIKDAFKKRNKGGK